MPKTKKAEPVIKTSSPIKTNVIARPWQGTLLAIINIISLLMTAVFLPLTILMIIAGGTLSSAQNLGPIFGLLVGGSGIILTLMLLFYLILGIFIIKGIFQGKKWAIIILLIFSVLGLVNIVFNFSLFSFILLAIFLYLEISCLTHPFYGNKK